MDVRTIEVAGRNRRATSPGSPGTVPLFYFNGIGANLEAVRGFAGEIGTIIFDVPGTATG